MQSPLYQVSFFRSSSTFVNYLDIERGSFLEISRSYCMMPLRDTSRMAQRFRSNDGTYTKDGGHSIYILDLGVLDM